MRKSVAGSGGQGRVQACRRWLSLGKFMSLMTPCSCSVIHTSTGSRYCTTAVRSHVPPVIFMFIFHALASVSPACHLNRMVTHPNITLSPVSVLSIILFTLSFFLSRSLHANQTSLSVYSPEAKCPAVFPGSLAPSISSGSMSLCTLSLVMLSEQEISHSIRLKRPRCADKARTEGAPSPCCSICRPRLAPRLSPQDICIFPTLLQSLSLLVSVHPQTHPIS